MSNITQSTYRLGSTALAVVLLAGCGQGTMATPSTASSQLASASMAPSAAPPSTAPSAMPLQVGCSDQAPCVLSPGRWALTGQFSFLLGMEITVPGGWQSLEQDAGEFNLFPVGNSNDHLFFVKDIAAVRTDGSMALAAGVPPTVEGLTGFWQRDPNLAVTEPASATIANGLEATTYVITISNDAHYIDVGCPAYPRCADLFTDPRYWDGPPYGIGAPETVRLYLTTIGSGAEKHVLAIGLQGEDASALGRLEAEAAPIIASIRLPAKIVVW